ncbi:MAG TPA: maltose alpha-D-glucosyltransferase [Gemmatimonadales bacterium]|nr:maltose alpha-D-glucosyltransferase [Gemmatimonadales bacterium]
MRRTGSATDPLWYQDAVIYELHVRGFADANQDGIGDFRGLIEKLDYLQDLGITCIWLLPFFPSPLKDDGYDIADYTAVHPAYGTLDDFRDFLNGAHARGIQVLIELVINHTSDQHPWFQAARTAPPGSPQREFYVWSDSDTRYAGARIIFTDTEKSNWTWDSEARAYYWHRFFSHQPDLNYDNPAVLEEIIRVMRFWLDLGVDGLRLDAIPYLVEREGTSCENLPEAHTIIKRLRAALDEQHANRMILAEANQLPRDVLAYFGDGDECHMAFHFPLMPRLFMALRLEDRQPVTEILAETPPLPAGCQWGLFLRNHDELTLEMVTDDERAYLYLAYGTDPRMRVNVGIRRRLAPLLENNRRRIELLNSILFSFPGTPILYYGDEIGMGDNIYLGDRNGVRTPMQWSADRNGGFSRVNPSRLYSPVIMDPVYGYEAVNVESQQGDPSSLLNWTKHMIALRKLFQVFGRGSIEFLHPANRKILAYRRTNGAEQILCVANLSRFAQPFELDLAPLAGMTPIEMLGYGEFPRIGRTPYPLTLGPYGFLWFELHGKPEMVGAVPHRAEAVPVLAAEVAAGWMALFNAPNTALLEQTILPNYLPRQRWFGAKSRPIQRCQVEDRLPLDEQSGVLLVAVHLDNDDRDTYVLPLALAAGEEADRVRETRPGAVLCALDHGAGILYEALARDATCRRLYELVHGGEIRGARGTLHGMPGRPLQAAPENGSAFAITRLEGDWSNSSTILGDQFILKLYRRLAEGPQPDCELTRYLTEELAFPGVPAYAGQLDYRSGERPSATIALLSRFVPDQVDAWRWMQEELGRFYERALTRPAPPAFPGSHLAGLGAWFRISETGLTDELDELLGISDEAAAGLGRRTAELHLALARPTADPAFSPEPMTRDDVRELAAQIRQSGGIALEMLKDAFPELPDDTVEPASRLLAWRGRLWQQVEQLPALLSDLSSRPAKIRIHGDYHLGQVLRVGTEFVIIDFEGEPLRPLTERRAKQPPLRDIAGMLRSFGYVAEVALQAHVARRPADRERLTPWAEIWEASVSGLFLKHYLETARGTVLLPADREPVGRLLEAYLLDKALYELRYELDHRPSWVGIPVKGLLGLLEGR